MPHCPRIMSAKSEEIKFRCEPLDKKSLLQIAEDEDLELSVILRRAVKDYIARQYRPSDAQPKQLTHG